MGFVADIWSSNKQASSQDKATKQTIAEQKRQFDLSRADQMPWMQAGSAALGQMQALNNGDFSKFYSSPDYQFALDQGMQGLDRSAAARGKLFSGGYGQDLTKYAQGMATQNYGNYYNRLAGLSGTGQTTATNLGSLGQSYANAFGNAQQNNATARSSSYANMGNALNTGINQFGSWLGGRSTPTYSGTGYSGSQWDLPDTSNNSWYTGVGSSGWSP
jgi:hypothetical protein